MKRHKRDTGGFGKYTLHPMQGAKAAPTHAHPGPSVHSSQGPELRTMEPPGAAAEAEGARLLPTGCLCRFLGKALASQAAASALGRPGLRNRTA